MNVTLREMTETDFSELEKECILGMLFEMECTYKEKLKDRFPNIEKLLEELMIEGYVESYSLSEGNSVYFLSLTGVAKLKRAGRSYELNAIDYRIGRYLAQLDLPITALLSAAYDKADHINKALIAGCWRQIANTTKQRFNAPGGCLADEKVTGIEDPLEARREYSARTFKIAESYFRPLLKMIKEEEP